MRNFLYKFQCAVSRFMYGRHGGDQLNTALLVAYLVLWLVGGLVAGLLRSQLLHSLFNLLMTVLIVAALFRTFSKNLEKRRAENAKFLQWWWPTKNKLLGAKARHQDKDHKYFTCKQCKTVCRVPAGKGKIRITCPKCGSTIEGKS